MPMQCWRREQYNQTGKMILIDTHTHLYLPNFKDDIEQVIQNAVEQHVKKMLLPNIDDESVRPMLELCKMFPVQCHPMIGLHPTSVGKDYREKLSVLESLFATEKFIAIGETGMDAYWDKTFIHEQEDSFIRHLEWARKFDLPVVIHSRETMDKTIEIIQKHSGGNLRGVFHAFSGSTGQAEKIVNLGFKLGIGGVVTYKNSGLSPVIEAADPGDIVLETDSPYLTPVPHRGKRNESANLVFIARTIANMKGMHVEEIVDITSKNASELFNLNIE